MKKVTTGANATAMTAEQLRNEILKGNYSPEILAQIEKLDMADFVSTQGKYFKMQENTEYRILVLGLTTMNNRYKKEGEEQKEVPAVEVYARDKEGNPCVQVTREVILLKEVQKYKGTFPVVVACITTNRVVSEDQKDNTEAVGYLNMVVAVYPNTPVDTETGEVAE